MADDGKEELMANIPVQSDDFQSDENGQDLSQANNQADSSQFGLADNTKNISVSGDDTPASNSASAGDGAVNSDDQSVATDQPDAAPVQTEETDAIDSDEQKINDSLSENSTEMPTEQVEAKEKMEQATNKANEALGDMFKVLGDESQTQDLEGTSSDSGDQLVQEDASQANNPAQKPQESTSEPAGEVGQDALSQDNTGSL